jgi:dihydrofolate reductase
MATVMMHAVASLDGFIADDHDDVGPLFDWYFNGTHPITTDGSEHGPFAVSAASAAYVRSMWQSIRVIVQGRRLFDLTNGWEASPPAGEHLFVVSHRPKPPGWHPEADVPFFDDVTTAVAEARRVAGDGVVAICAGEMGGSALAAGVVDEVAIDVVPVVFGSGRRYFGSLAEQRLLEDPDVVVQGDRVLHLRYRVRR